MGNSLFAFWGGLLATCSAATVLLALLFRQISSILRAGETQRAATEQTIKDLQTQVEAVTARLQEADRYRASVQTPVPAGGRTSINLTFRSQVLRLHRHGHSLEDIASSLSVPLGEVALLVKVQDLVTHP